MMFAIAAAASGQVRIGVYKQRRANRREAEYKHQQDGRDAPHSNYATPFESGIATRLLLND